MQSLSDFLVSLNLEPYVNGWSWVWPLGEILHFVGMALLIGTVGLVDIRVLGFVKGLPIATLERMVPFGVVGFLMNAITGFIFVAGNPDGGPMVYLDNLAFQLKMLLVLIAGLNLLIYQVTGIARRAAETGPYGEAGGAAKVVAIVSLVAWIGVICFGRLIMYNDTLLYALGL
jgi:hypothetical protein